MVSVFEAALRIAWATLVEDDFMAQRNRVPQPEDLLFMLVDSVMARLSPNAWKVVSYIASQHMRVQDEFFFRRADPAMFFSCPATLSR